MQFGWIFAHSKRCRSSCICYVYIQFLSTVLSEDFSNTYLAGYGYGYGMRMLLDRYAGQHNGFPGQFGWTGGSGTWAESSPEEGISIVYMHNLQPNLEEYHHLRMRAVAYGCL